MTPPRPSRGIGLSAALLATGLLLAGCGSAQEAAAPPAGQASPTPAQADQIPPAPPSPRPPGTTARPGAGVRALLQAAPGGDGDSWRDTTGAEYRLGMVNAPEAGDCYAAEATRARKALTDGGFTVDAYARDDYGRNVAVVTAADGTIVNVELARRGLVDDRYLARFRSENPSLAVQLDKAFAAAKAERAGLWGAC